MTFIRSGTKAVPDPEFWPPLWDDIPLSWIDWATQCWCENCGEPSLSRSLGHADPFYPWVFTCDKCVFLCGLCNVRPVWSRGKLKLGFLACGPCWKASRGL